MVSGSLSALAIYWARTRFELAGIVRSLPTLVFIMLPVLAAFPVLIFGGTSEADNDTLLPVSAIIVPKLAEAVAAGAGLFAVIFAGEMMWRERQAAMHEIVEAAGVPPLAVLAGKLMALALVIALQYLVVSIIGIVWQATHGAPQINISHYAARLFLAEWTTSLMVAAFAMFVHAVVSYRIAAHLISLGLLILFGSFDQLGIEHSLLIFGNVPKIELSDMNGLGHYVAPALWFVTYWVLISAVLFLLADLIGTGSQRARARQTARRADGTAGDTSGAHPACGRRRYRWECDLLEHQHPQWLRKYLEHRAPGCCLRSELSAPALCRRSRGSPRSTSPSTFIRRSVRFASRAR